MRLHSATDGIAALRVTWLSEPLFSYPTLLLTPFSFANLEYEWTLLHHLRRSNGLTSAMGSRSLG